MTQSGSTESLLSLVKPDFYPSIWRCVRQSAPEQRRGFLPLCPDFAVELMSRSDSWIQTQRLAPVGFPDAKSETRQAKMVEYMESGCRLAWLLDPKGKRAAVYRVGKPPELLIAPDSLSGEDVLPGFVLNTGFLWG